MAKLKEKLFQLATTGKEIVQRYRYYHGDDCYIYETLCSCGDKIGGWSEHQANEAWEKHKCGEVKVKISKKRK